MHQLVIKSRAVTSTYEGHSQGRLTEHMHYKRTFSSVCRNFSYKPVYYIDMYDITTAVHVHFHTSQSTA